jgi:hypothetical protein
LELLPAIQRRRKIHNALDSLRQSIRAAAVEVKQKNFYANAIYKTLARHKTPRVKI